MWETSPTKRETLAALLGGAVTKSSVASSDLLSTALLAGAAAARIHQPPSMTRPGFQLPNAALVFFFTRTLSWHRTAGPHDEQHSAAAGTQTTQSP